VARRLLRVGLYSVLGLAGLVLAGGVVLALSFDLDSLKPRIIAAVKQATGRDLTLQGPIRLGWSLRPTLTLRDASLSNPPGFTRAQMATLQRLEVKLALLPLLSRRVEIARLALEKPDIILETDAQGRPNWLFAPEPRPAAPPNAVSGGEHEPLSLDVSNMRIENGTLTWHDGRTGRSATFAIGRLEAEGAAANADMHVTMSASYEGAPFTLHGVVGPLAELANQRTTAAWPVQARLQAGGAQFTIEGSVAQPGQSRGYRLQLAATIPNLAGLAPFAAGVRLPPLHDVSLNARLDDTGAGPTVSAVTVHVGQSNLADLVPGLRLDRLEAETERPDQPLQVSAQARLSEAPLNLTGSIGAPVMPRPEADPAASVPLDIRLKGLGSSVALRGDAGRAQDGRPVLHADVIAEVIDLDGLFAALPRPSEPAAEQRPVAPVPAPAARPARAGVIPETPISFGLLHDADGSGKLSVARLIWRGVTYSDLTVQIDLKDGRLRLDPFSVDLPGGHADGALSADASQPTPTVGLKLRSPSLAVQSLLAALNLPGFMTGNLRVQADLHGAGETPRAIAASLGGSLGLAMVNGTVDNRLLGSALGAILREANLLDLVGRGGNSQLQCFVARFDATEGIATLRPMVLASSLLTVDGSGTINLRNETLDLHLRPQGKVGGTTVVVPLRVSGSLRSPSAVPDPAAALTQNAGTVAEALLGRTNPLGAVAGALGAEQLLSGNTSGCGSAPHVPAAPVPQPAVPNVGGALKQLLR
jgi:AsmA protein